MKASTLHTFLEDCRAACTSDAISGVVEQIEQKIGAMRAERAGVEGQLQEAIVAGRDPGKVHTAIAQLDQDLMTLEAARAGFSQKQADVRKSEETAETQALLSKHRLQSQELVAATNELAASVEKTRAAVAKVAAIARDHERVVVELEARKKRPEQRATVIMRQSIGEVRRGDGVTEYHRRADILLADLLSMSPGQLMRARDARRQGGRFGETYAAQDHAVEALMGQVRNTRAAG